jgi:hypothetical protein
MSQIPFIGGAYKAWSGVAAAQECVNLYPEMTPDGKGVKALRGTPGTVLFCNLGPQPVRAMLTHGVLMYAVAGNKLYSVSAAGVATELGTLDTTYGRVSMSHNGMQIMLVDGVKGYTYTLATSTFAKITDTDFPVADVCLFLDGYSIVNKAGSGSYQISSPYDSTAWAALDIKTAEGDPDNLVTLAKRNRQLFAIGDTTTEVYYNSGNATFPFDRVNGLLIDVGCQARWSVATVNQTLVWLAKSAEGAGYVIRLDGYSPVRISTPALENAIAGYGDVSDAFAYSYSREGHIFYALTFPTARETWVYDVAGGEWHKRETYGCDGRHLSNTHIFFNGKHYVGDYRNGKIYELSEEAYTDAGALIERWRTSPYLYDDNRQIVFSTLEVGFETGIGNSACPDPQAMLQWSDDGGRTWSNEHWRPIGKVGKYGSRVKWHRLGKSRQRLLKVKVSDPVKVVMVNASVNGG